MKQMLQTSVTRVEYDFVRCAGKLYQGVMCYCDMTECIDYFKQIDAEVKRIDTYVGGKPDTVYVLNGGWKARRV